MKRKARKRRPKDEGRYVCEACGEEIVIPIDLSAGESQEYVEDCPVCCRPNVIRVEIDEDGTGARMGERRVTASLGMHSLCVAAKHWRGTITVMATVDTPLFTPQLLAQLERLELVSRKIFRGRMKGERRSKRKGQSVEFADFRSYVAGDDLRFIDWNSFARLDRLFLKLFLEEEDLRFYVLLDTSASMDFGEPTKARYARQLAAALGFIGLVRGDQVHIETLGQSVRQRSPVWRGRHNVWRMVEQLDRIESEPTTPLASGIKNFCLRNPGKGVVVLVSDLMDKAGYEDAMRWLVAQQMDAYVIHLLSQEELTPDVTGDLRLVDCEDHDVAEISISAALLKRYQTNLASFLDGARSFCTRRGMTYLTTTTQLPVETLVSNYLRKGGLVR